MTSNVTKNPTSNGPMEMLKRIMERLKSVGCRIRSWTRRYGFTTLAVFVLAGLAAFAIWILCFEGWGWLGEKPENNADSNGMVLRNIALTVAGVVGVFIGLPLAIWRSQTVHKQAETAQKQAQTVERRLLNERYQKGADMLGSGTPATRFGGIMALEQIAQEHPEDYHIQIMNLLCAFARHPTHDTVASDKSSKGNEISECRPDVEQAVQIIGRRNSAQYGLEDKEEWHANLTGVKLMGAKLMEVKLTGVKLMGADLGAADLWGADLTKANLEGADMWDAELCGAKLADADLTKANLAGTDLMGAILTGAKLVGAKLVWAHLVKADLGGADLMDANLTGTRLMEVKGLTQDQLDLAKIEKGGNPPDLSNAICAASGEPLVWKAKTSSV